MFEFPCPHCSVPLRLRDAGMKGRTIPCPDCGEPVEIREINGALYGAVGAETPFSDGSPLPYPRAPLLPRLLIVGSVVVLVLVLLLVNFRRDRPAEILVEERPRAAAPEPVEAEEDKEAGEPAPRAEQGPAVSPVEATLKGIYEYISEHHAAQEIFPQGAPASGQPQEARFSWIADLMKQQANRQPNWDQPWNAPVNDEFVRRRLREFENPRIDQVAGEDRYPATHFVGVTGVGADAATLPKRHPRAGIFGYNRQTTVEDVTDGLANTMMVAGVNRRLGSWGRAGDSTMRGFSEEPYVNGPDGFGTGQKEGMHVLMADGSVRFLSARTDPVIVRRMAAMADGLPLDPSVPGDPLAMTMEPPQPPAPKPVPGEVPEEAGPPIEVPLASDLPPFDVRKSLQQKIVLFSTDPTPLQTLLGELEELIGAPIDLSQVPEERQQVRIGLNLQDVTLAEILTELAQAAGVRFETDSGRIRFHDAATEP